MTETTQVTNSPITVRQVVEEALRLAEENEDFTYRPRDPNLGSMCYYTTGPKHLDTGEHLHEDGCIFGQALTNLGIPEEILSRADERIEDGDGMGVAGLLRHLSEEGLLVGLSEDAFPLQAAYELLEARVQIKQDQGEPWGQCASGLREALDYLDAHEARQ